MCNDREAIDLGPCGQEIMTTNLRSKAERYPSRVATGHSACARELGTRSLTAHSIGTNDPRMNVFTAHAHPADPSAVGGRLDDTRRVLSWHDGSSRLRVSSLSRKRPHHVRPRRAVARIRRGRARRGAPPALEPAAAVWVRPCRWSACLGSRQPRTTSYLETSGSRPLASVVATRV